VKQKFQYSVKLRLFDNRMNWVSWETAETCVQRKDARCAV